MISSPLRRLGLPVAAYAGLLLLAGPAAAQKSSVPFGQGTHALRVLLHRAKLTPIASEAELLKELRDHPQRVLILSLGKQQWLADMGLDLFNFHKNGGAFLGASDQATAQWVRPYEWSVTGEFLSGADGYRGSSDCPFVVPFEDAKCPVFRGVRGVATNRPSYLDPAFRADPVLPLIARLDKVIPIDDSQLNPTNTLFAAGGPLGRGRVLLLADHSVFINDMMLPTDNGNFDFARSAIDWLTEHGRRDRVFFIDDGVVVTNFNVPVKDMPQPAPDDILKALLKALTELKWQELLRLGVALWHFGDHLGQEGIIERQLGYVGRQLPVMDRQLGKAIPRTGLLRGLALGLSVGLTAFALTWLVRARHQIDAQVPLLGQALSTVQSSQALMERRRTTVVRGGNFWETAHALACQFFDGLGQGTALPELTGVDRHQQRQMRRLWQLARPSRPWRISAREFNRVLADLDGLRTALANGTLRWAPAVRGTQGAA